MPHLIAGKSRKEKSLSRKLDKQLLAYTATAGAAGVAALALTQPAAAKVVYTPTNVTIPLNGGPVYLDLNNDGVADFALQNSTYAAGIVFRGQHRDAVGRRAEDRSEDRSGEGRHGEGADALPFFRDLIAVPQQAGDAVFGYVDTSQGLDVGCAAALPAGVKVGPKSPFLTSNRVALSSEVLSYSYGHVACEWGQRHRGAYLGVKFSINGQTHYGWAHITIGSTAVLSGYAYETVPNQPIETGKTSGLVAALDATTLPALQPATLGMLAQGSRGLAIWRREEEQA